MIKQCPLCGSNELDSEPSAEPVGVDGKLVDAVSYVCLDCGTEFAGISGHGLQITNEGEKQI